MQYSPQGGRAYLPVGRGTRPLEQHHVLDTWLLLYSSGTIQEREKEREIYKTWSSNKTKTHRSVFFCHVLKPGQPQVWRVLVTKDTKSIVLVNYFITASAENAYPLEILYIKSINISGS